MSQVLEIKTVVETEQAEKNTDELLDSMKELITVQKESLEEQKKLGTEAVDSTKAATKSTSLWGKAFKGLGNAIKLAGIGLLLGIVATLSEAFQKNQVIVDKVNTVFNAFSTAVNDFVDFMMSGNVIDTITGFFGALIDDPMETIKGAAKSMTEYAEATYDAADAVVQLEKNSRIAAAQQQRLIEQYDRAAEKQRQIRDDESKTVEERFEANEKLGKILEQQIASETALINIRVKAAKLALEQNNNIDNEVALIEALTEQDELLARVEGFRSEQLINRVSLQKELNEELERTKMIEDVEGIGKIEPMQAKDLSAEGEIKLQQGKNLVDGLAAVNERFKAEQLKKAEDQAAKELEISQKKAAAEEGLQMGLAALQSLIADKGSKEAKALAVAQVLFDTYRGIQAAFSTANANVAANTATFGAYSYIQAASAAAFGFANLRAIKNSGKNSGATTPNISAPSGISSDTPRIPNFSSINRGVGGNDNFNSMRAVVVNQQLKDTEALDNRVTDLINLGN